MKMINKTEFKRAKLPKMMGDLLHSNQFLKMFSLYALTLALITTIALGVVAMKEPMILTIDSNGKVLNQGVSAKAEDQISEAAKSYMERRYKWNSKNVVKNLKLSESFILPNNLKAFQESISKVARFSTEKNVSQTIYPEALEVDLMKKTILVKGTRVTSIQGMKAAGDLKLELTFESGSRSKENPWGVYITKEKED